MLLSFITLSAKTRAYGNWSTGKAFTSTMFVLDHGKILSTRAYKATYVQRETVCGLFGAEYCYDR